jgi:Cu/Ag efflux pump CusA
MNGPLGVAGRIARAFIDSKLTALIIFGSVLLGLAAVWLLPREEEPQIKVPMINVLVSMPGAGSKEIEERVTRPMEKLLWEIPGVEYVYSTSRPGESLLIVRFVVGSSAEQSVVRLNQKLQSNFDRIPHGVSQPLIKVRSIDDVPILALTFHSERYDQVMLRRLVAQVDDAINQIPSVAETQLIGGGRRQVRVLLDPASLASRGLSPAGLIPRLRQANRQYAAGGLTSENREILIETGGFLETAEDVGNVVVGVSGGKPVYLREVAQIVDGAAEPSNYVFFGEGSAPAQPAVTLTVATWRECDLHRARSREKTRYAQRLANSCWSNGFHCTRLRRNGGRKVERAAVSHADRRGQRLGADSPGRPGDGRCAPGGAGGHQLSDLRRPRCPLQLQWTRAPLLYAQRRQCGGYSGKFRRQE